MQYWEEYKSAYCDYDGLFEMLVKWIWKVQFEKRGMHSKTRFYHFSFADVTINNKIFQRTS